MPLQSHISESWRALLSPFFAYALFNRVAEYHKNLSLKPIYPALCAALFFGTQLIGIIPTTLVWVSLLSVLTIIPIQYAVNRINRTEAPLHDPNSRFSRGQKIFITISSILLIIIVFAAVYDWLYQEPPIE